MSDGREYGREAEVLDSIGTECAQPSSHLTKNLCEEIPALSHQDIIVQDKVALIRSWVSKSIPIGTRSTWPADGWWFTPVEKLVNDALQGRTGMACGGTAHILAQIYGLFGLTAFTFNFGESSASHVVTLVRIDDDVLSVQDAYLNYALTDHTGEVLDFEAILLLIESGRHSDVWIAADASPRPVLVGRNDNMMSFWPIAGNGFDVTCNQNVHIECSVNDFDYASLAFWGGFKRYQALADSSGLQRSWFAPMLTPINVSDQSAIAVFPEHAPSRTEKIMKMVAEAQGEIY